MCVLYGSKPSNVRTRTFGWVPMSIAVLFIIRIFCRICSEQSASCLSGFNVRLLCLSRPKLYVDMVVCIYLLHSCLCV